MAEQSRDDCGSRGIEATLRHAFGEVANGTINLDTLNDGRRIRARIPAGSWTASVFASAERDERQRVCAMTTSCLHRRPTSPIASAGLRLHADTASA